MNFKFNVRPGASRLFAVTALALSTFATVFADYFVTSGPSDTNGAVYRFADDGSPLGSFGNSVLRLPIGIAQADDGTLLVADYGNQNVRAFKTDGTDLGVIINNIDAASLIIDSYGDLLVANYGGARIRRFTQSGSPLGDFALTGLQRHSQMAMDLDGNIYVASYLEDVIQRYDKDGNSLGNYSDSAQSGIYTPTGLAFLPDGTMIVSETFGNVIDRLDTNGDMLGQFATTGMDQPEWLTVEPSGDILLPSWSSGTVRRYDAVGNDLGDFVSVPHGYQIINAPVQLPVTLAPTAINILLGSNANGGTFASLANDDSSFLKICKAFVPSLASPKIRFEANFGPSPYLNPSVVTVDLKARMSTGGVFNVRVYLANRTGGGFSYTTAEKVIGDVAINTTYASYSANATGSLARYIYTDGSMRTRTEIQQAGFSATSVPCAEFELLNVTVSP